MSVKSFSSICVCLILFNLISCSSSDRLGSNQNTVTKETPALSETPQKIEGSYYTILEFDKGNHELSEESKKDLHDFLSKAKKNGKIDNIKILSWADKEYPKKGANLPDQDITMADARAKAIENYLKEDLKTTADYSSYNMAKRPNRVSEFFRADDYKTKRLFEKDEIKMTNKKKKDGLQSFLKNKASKSIIMLDYE